METEQQDKAHTNVRIPRDLLERMRRLAHVHARSLNREIEVAIREYAARHTDDEKQSSKVAC